MNPAWITAVVSVFLGFVAIFGDRIRAYIARPKLDLAVSTAPPDCVFIPLVSKDPPASVPSYYFRLRVINSGKSTAKEVEVYAEELALQRADHTFEVVRSFTPCTLNWSNVPGASALSQIHRDTSRHCDLGRIVEPINRHVIASAQPPGDEDDFQTAWFEFEFTAKPTNRTHVIPPGRYRLKLVVSAENARAVVRHVSIYFTGRFWGDDRMLRDDVAITVAPPT